MLSVWAKLKKLINSNIVVRRICVMYTALLNQRRVNELIINVFYQNQTASYYFEWTWILDRFAFGSASPFGLFINLLKPELIQKPKAIQKGTCDRSKSEAV